MNTSQKQTIESFLRVQAFLPKYPATPPLDYSDAKADLDSAVERVSAHALAQAAGRRTSRAETQRLYRAIDVLRLHHLRPIVMIARASMRTKPGIHVALRTPRSNMPVTRLIEDARAVRRVAGEYEEYFLAKKRPPDFLKQLDAAIAEVRRSVAARAEETRAAVGANAGITEELIRGRKAVAMLDSIVAVVYEGQRSVLAEWENAKRVQATSAVSSAPLGDDTELQPAA